MVDFDDIIPEFILEFSPTLHSIEGGLLQLEDGGAAEPSLQDLFLAIHKIKAGAGLAGLEKIERLSREMDGVLDLCRNGALEPAQAVVDSLLQALDVLTSLFDRMEEHESIDIHESILALQAVTDAGVDQRVKRNLRPVEFNALPNGIPDFEVSAYSLQNKMDQGNVFFLNLELGRIESYGLSLMQLLSEMLSMGEILGSKLLPPVDDPDSDPDAPVWFDILFASALNSDQLLGALPMEAGDCHLIQESDISFQSAPTPEPQPQIKPKPEPVEEETPPPAEERAPVPVKHEPPAPSQTGLPEPSQAALALAENEEQRGMEYLTFTLGHETYGVDILSVQEIITMPPLSKLPRAAQHVLGVMNLRGMVVPVLDMRILLDLPLDAEVEPVVVVLNDGSRCMGAVVDSVSDVLEILESDVQEPPDFAGAVHREFLLGLYRHQDDLVILLELDRILWLEALGRDL